MIDQPSTNAPTIVAVSVGNSRVRAGIATQVGNRPEIEQAASHAPSDAAEAVLALSADVGAVVLASVNDTVSNQLESTLRSSGLEVLRINRDVSIPLQHTLTDPSTLGQDRALNALAAFRRVEQACVVIDAGTAITIDFVDGEGTFHGGIIAPGARMMLQAMHAQADALPEVAFESLPDPLEPFGRDTQSAMLLGAASSARGLARYMVERYAEFYGAFAQVIATGGDAEALYAQDEFIETIVPDLTLLGIAEAFYEPPESGS